ncbi:CRISPR-associated CARF protein Csx1 [Sulfurisphaera ohwakuensis]|uniref:CRISPR-associated CARF protein Csx1 n=1 Tax=Sulfurisphaera ohwakuensis TaxID=69656 RepID=UPI0036F1B707
MKILFAPIGDPKNYEEVEYIVNSGKINTNASFKAISESYGVKDVIVYAGLSLCDTGKYKDYQSCVSSIINEVKSKLSLRDEMLIIVPNVYGNKYVQEDRKITLFSNSIYYNTLKILEERKPNEIIIDITHGINYMPLLATDSIKLATYTYMVGEKDKVTIEIFNSEPVIRGNKGPYHISKVYEEKVDVRQTLLSILSYFLSADFKNKVANNVLKGVSNCNADLIMSSANALFSGIFIFLASVRKELEECLKAVEEKINILDYRYFRGNLVVDNGIVYKDRLPLELTYVHSLLTIIKKITSGIGMEVKLSDIRLMAEKYSTSETIKSIVLNEIDQINKKIDILDSSFQLYADILRSADKEEEKGKECEPNKRNLFAHGGFEKNVTYLRKEGNEVYVSYGKCLENVKKHLQSRI